MKTPAEHAAEIAKILAGLQEDCLLKNFRCGTAMLCKVTYALAAYFSGEIPGFSIPKYLDECGQKGCLDCFGRDYCV